MLPNIQKLDLSDTNIFQVLSLEETSAFAQKLINHNSLEFLGLRNTCPTVHNCSKYLKILNAIGSGFKGDNHLRIRKLDLTGNIVLCDAIANFVIPYVQELKMSQNECYIDV